MKLEDAPELNRDLKSPIQEMDLEDHLTRLTLLPGSDPGLATLPLRTPISNKNSPMSKLQNLDMQVQGCQDATQRIHKEWRAHAYT